MKTLAGSNIFVVGPMGAGKTTIGRRLAARCGLQFVDSDHEIEARTGVDIPHIFEREGEAGFRSRECIAIAELSARQGIVLATGGGAVLDADSRRLLAARGYVVYLHASVDQQLARTARAGNRPLLKHAGDRRQVLTCLFEQRDPLYRQIADLVLVTDGRSTKALVHEIVQRFGGASVAI